MHTLSHHVLAPTATAAFYLTPRQLVSQSLSSLGLSLSLLSPVFLLESAAASVPHVGQNLPFRFGHTKILLFQGSGFLQGLPRTPDGDLN